MCCGKNRELLRQADPVRVESDLSVQRSGVIHANVAASAPIPVPAPSITSQEQDCVFEYRGNTAMIAIGGITGTRYYFSEAGKRLKIDSRDRHLLAMLNGLVEVELP